MVAGLSNVNMNKGLVDFRKVSGIPDAGTVDAGDVGC